MKIKAWWVVLGFAYMWVFGALIALTTNDTSSYVTCLFTAIIYGAVATPIKNKDTQNVKHQLLAN